MLVDPLNLNLFSSISETIWLIISCIDGVMYFVVLVKIHNIWVNKHPKASLNTQLIIVFV